MKKYLILFVIAFIFTGCNNDDFNNETPYNATDIIGEWLFYEDINKSYVRESHPAFEFHFGNVSVPLSR